MNQLYRRGRSASLLKMSCLAVLVAVSLSANVDAQQRADIVLYSVPAGDLAKVINEISRSSGVQIVYDMDLLRGRTAGEVKGSLTLKQALDRALSNTGLGWARPNATTVYIQKMQAPKRPALRKKSGTTSNSVPPAGNEQGIQDLDSVVVVGSRLGSSPVESAMPIKLITREDIDRSGAGNIAQMLTYLSEVPINSTGDRDIGGGNSVGEGGNSNSTSVQMRGLQRGTTLVLINGHRAGDSGAFSDTGQFDLSTIPLALVERIEVLPAGSSAIYGGDGMAGIVNIVLRRDASGFEMRFRKSAAEGYGTRQASAIWGKSWSSGGLTVAANWSKSGGLFNDERDITADTDYRRFGGYDMRDTSGYPATIYSLAGCPALADFCEIPLEERAPLPGLHSPVAVVPGGSNGKDLTPADFLGTQGQRSVSIRKRHLRSEESGYGITIDGRLELLQSLEGFAQLTYSNRDVPAYQSTFWTWGGEWAIAGALVPAENPYNPFGVAVGVDYSFLDTGIYTSYSHEHYRGLLGLRGKVGRFDWELTGWQGRDKSHTTGFGFDEKKIAAALASTDPAKTLNLFASDGSAPASPEVMRSLLSDALDQDAGARTTGANGFVKGSLITLPAGELIGLLGLETQTQAIEIESKNGFLLAPSLSGSSTSKAAFTEIRVPILSPRAGQTWERAAFSGAFRRESSDRYRASALTKTFGLEARPWESLLLRSTYSTSFRPVTTHTAIQDPREVRNSVTDPKFGGQSYFIRQISSGGAPQDLGPETGKTITMGFTYRPSQDWSLSLSYWDIGFRDQIAYVGLQTIVEHEELYPDRVRRNPNTGLIELVDSRQVNISSRDTNGLDISGDGVWTTQFGDFYPSISATFTHRYSQQLTEGAPVVKSLARYNAAGWAPRWKIVPRLGWDYHDWARVMLVGRYVSKYVDPTPLVTGPKQGTLLTLGDFWIFDFNLDLSLNQVLGNESVFGGTRVNVGVSNVANKLPVYCNSCGNVGYDASQYDIVGRTIYAELRMSF